MGVPWGVVCGKPTTAAQQSLAQNATPPVSKQQNGPPASTPQNAAQKFPYPGTTTTDESNTKDAKPVPDAPAAKRFPYPGESGESTPDAPAADAAKGMKTPPSDADAGKDDGFGSSSSSSSGMDQADPDADALKDEGSSGDVPTPTRFRRKKLAKVDAQTPESRESEDLDVAEFYQKSGNFNAAYLRAKDAVGIKADDPFAHFALAEAARKLGKPDEAKEHYALVLKLDPEPKEKKAAERALAELTAKR